MNKVELRIEKIFAHAAALQQNGRLRNTVYGIKRAVFILNQDHTVLIRFPMIRKKEIGFEMPISFNTNDYDSNTFKEKNGKIIFIQHNGDYVREKSCSTPQFSPKAVQKLFKKLSEKATQKNKYVVLDSHFTSLLDEDLSHIEFSAKKGKLITKQRNIYSGSVITIKGDAKKGFVSSKMLKSFKPIGIRTKDFLALFSFVDCIEFFFNKNTILFNSLERTMPFTGIISQCIYDELGGE